jgi:hypothetical protein
MTVKGRSSYICVNMAFLSCAMICLSHCICKVFLRLIMCCMCSVVGFTRAAGNCWVCTISACDSQNTGCECCSGCYWPGGKAASLSQLEPNQGRARALQVVSIVTVQESLVIKQNALRKIWGFSQWCDWGSSSSGMWLFVVGWVVLLLKDHGAFKFQAWCSKVRAPKSFQTPGTTHPTQHCIWEDLYPLKMHLYQVQEWMFTGKLMSNPISYLGGSKFQSLPRNCVPRQCGFPQPLQANAGVVPWLDHSCLLPDPFQFIIHQSSYRSVLYNLS